MGQAWWGAGPYLACGVLWSRPGAGSLLVPGGPPLGLLYLPGLCGPSSRRKEKRGQQGAGKSWGAGSSWGNPQSHPGGGSRTSSVVVLALQPTQIQGDKDRYFTLTLGLSSGPLHLTLTSEVGEVSESPSQLTKEGQPHRGASG